MYVCTCVRMYACVHMFACMCMHSLFLPCRTHSYSVRNAVKSLASISVPTATVHHKPLQTVTHVLLRPYNLS